MVGGAALYSLLLSALVATIQPVTMTIGATVTSASPVDSAGSSLGKASVGSFPIGSYLPNPNRKTSANPFEATGAAGAAGSASTGAPLARQPGSAGYPSDPSTYGDGSSAGIQAGLSGLSGGAYPAGSFPGAYPAGPYPAGPFAPSSHMYHAGGAYPQGAYPQGYQQGPFMPGMMPPQGNYPQGSFPQAGAFPQGQHPAQPYQMGPYAAAPWGAPGADYAQQQMKSAQLELRTPANRSVDATTATAAP